MSSQLPRRALIALTSHSAPFYPDGRVNGVFYTEVAHPYQVLRKAGFEIDLASETGTYVIDEYSLDTSFLHDGDQATLSNPHHPFTKLLRDGVKKASDLDASNYGMFFASAGFASVYDYPTASALQAVATDVWNRGGVVAAVCHGAAILSGVKDGVTGQSIAAGKDVTGFSTEGDQMAGVLDKIHGDGVKTTEEAVVADGGHYVAPHPPFDAFCVTSGRVVTGANPASAQITALAALDAFEKAESYLKNVA